MFFLLSRLIASFRFSGQLHHDAAVPLEGFMNGLVGVAQLPVEKEGGVGFNSCPLHVSCPDAT